MKGPGNLFLVGMMGAGKTTVGRLLARRLKLRFFDCDLEIERRCGVKVPTIFDIEGEAGFRLREMQTLEQLTALEDAGYIEIRKGFVGKRPRTSARLSPAGREAFNAHVAALQRIVQQAGATQAT